MAVPPPLVPLVPPALITPVPAAAILPVPAPVVAPCRAPVIDRWPRVIRRRVGVIVWRRWCVIRLWGCIIVLDGRRVILGCSRVDRWRRIPWRNYLRPERH